MSGGRSRLQSVGQPFDLDCAERIDQQFYSDSGVTATREAHNLEITARTVHRYQFHGIEAQVDRLRTFNPAHSGFEPHRSHQKQYTATQLVWRLASQASETGSKPVQCTKQELT